MNSFIKKKNYIQNYYAILLVVSISFVVFALDIVTKRLVFSYIDAYFAGKNSNLPNHWQNQIAITSFFSLVKVWNSGISFGMLSQIKNSQIIFSTLQFIIGLFVLIWGGMHNFKQKKLLLVATGLISGGAFGNSIDRMQMGAVADFLDFHINNYHWPAFNLADSAIFLGVVILIINDLMPNKNNNAKIANKNYL